MQSNKDKSYESVSVTPVIKDIENIIVKLFSFFKLLVAVVVRWFGNFVSAVILNYKKIIIGTVIGATLGFVSMEFIPRTYRSSLILSAKFDSPDQLYSDINYFQSLVKNKNTERLALILNISEEEAKTLTRFEIHPYGSLFHRIRAINQIKSEVDSSSWKYFDDLDVLEGEMIDMFNNHIITIHSTNSTIFEKLEGSFLMYLERVEELQHRIANDRQIMEVRRKVIFNRINGIDSLLRTYTSILKSKAVKEKATSVTNISLGATENEQVVNPLSLYDKYEEYQNELEYIERQILIYQTCYQVIAHLNPEGEKEWLGRFGRTVVFGGISGILTLLGLLAFGQIRQINRG